MSATDATWFTTVLEPLRDEAVQILQDRHTNALFAYRLLKLQSKVIVACRDAGIKIDEAEIVDEFASLVFQHLMG